jgi:hypothetical protein
MIERPAWLGFQFFQPKSDRADGPILSIDGGFWLNSDKSIYPVAPQRPSHMAQDPPKEQTGR